jgi:hypothetical protein
MTAIKQQLHSALSAGKGVLRLAPTWVPRPFLTPGRRLRLDPRDLYVLGAQRGAIDERWLGSTVQADNGPGTPEDEGLSYVVGPDGETFTLIDAVREDGAALLGDAIMDEFGGWPVFAKLFDNDGPIQFHLHPRREHTELVGRQPKPEAYYFPVQYNAHLGRFPYTFFGLEGGTTREDMRECLARWGQGDNGVLDLSRAYRLNPGDAYLIPAGMLHAPGSLLTYEVQWGSDVSAVFQSMIEGAPIGWEFVVKDVPQDKRDDLNFVLDLIDWELNLDPAPKRSHYQPRKPHDSGAGWREDWINYGTVEGRDLFSVRELTLEPGAEVTLSGGAPNAALVIQGIGQFGPHPAAAPTLIRYGDLTNDEFFVSAGAEVAVKNTGLEPLVILRYFGPGAQET